MEFKHIHTRFRAYQLGSKGSSFSYWDSNTNSFWLCEARYNDDNITSIQDELRQCNKTKIDNLYISSWDTDHCQSSELSNILKIHKPTKIYYPRHYPDPEKQNQIDSKKLIDTYIGPPIPFKSDCTNLASKEAIDWQYTDVFYLQKLTGKVNDDSFIFLFRSGNFSVLSLGDLESEILSKEISNIKVFKETDILILPHHGSSRDFTTVELLQTINPKVCIALVDRENQYGHPDATVYQRVYENSWYYSTKDGDVIIESNGAEHAFFTVYNYISNGKQLKTVKNFSGKRIDAYRNQFGRFFGFF